jgi:hypothetical protein
MDRGGDALSIRALPRLSADPVPAPLPKLPSLDAEAAMGPLPPPPVPVVRQPMEPLRAPPPPEPADLASILADIPDPPVAPPSTPPRVPSDSPQAVPAPSRVFIHYSAVNSDSKQRAERLAAVLRGQGFRIAGLRPVPFQIGEPSVRYFFDDNAADATALAELSSSALPRLAGLADRGPSDFTHFAPKPQPGTLEIWVPAG